MAFPPSVIEGEPAVAQVLSLLKKVVLSTVPEKLSLLSVIPVRNVRVFVALFVAAADIVKVVEFGIVAIWAPEGIPVPLRHTK